VAHSLSAKKRIRQNVKCRARNRARKVQIKQVTRDFEEAVAGGDAAKSGEALKAAIKKIDQVAAKGTIHKNAAARKKSRLQKKLNALSAKS
jgi:small subunit ribosomal protein S20